MFHWFSIIVHDQKRKLFDPKKKKRKCMEIYDMKI